MKRYLVPHCGKSRPDWADLPGLAIAEPLLPAEDGTRAGGKLCWNSSGLHVCLFAEEREPLCRFSGESDPVWRDSCLEMFFCPLYEDLRYFNIECNPNGASFWGFGTGRADRTRLHPEDIRTLFSLNPFTFAGGWGIQYTVPVETIRLFFPEFEPVSGAKLRANFYKCGEDKPHPHELTWSPITNGLHDFHQPDFFGELCLA